MALPLFLVRLTHLVKVGENRRLQCLFQRLEFPEWMLTYLEQSQVKEWAFHEEQSRAQALTPKQAGELASLADLVSEGI